MEEDQKSQRIVRFGAFEADLAAGQLRKNGLRIRLQELPFRVLALLLEHPGEVITRDDLREKLWPADTFVEFENSLNTAVNRLRAALGDSADHPRYVETLPRRGYRFIGAVDGVGAIPMVHPDPAGSVGKGARGVFIALPAVLLVSFALNVALWVRTPGTNPDLPLRKFSVTPREDATVPVISPNGRYIAYLTLKAWDKRTLWIHDLEKDKSRAIAGPASIRFPFWSPDSNFIGFYFGLGAGELELRKISVNGGPSIPICKPPGGAARSRADWSPDGQTIVFATSTLFEVPSEGGIPKPLLSQKELEEAGPIWDDARFLPGRVGSHRLLVAAGKPDETQIIALGLDQGRRTVLASGNWPAWSPTGHVLYESSGVLWAVPFSPETFARTGEAFPIAENAAFSRASVASDGTLVYRGSPGGKMQLVWRDRKGRGLGAVGQPQRSIAMPVLSPDGTRVVVLAQEDHEYSDVWIHDIARGLKRPFTFGPTREDRAIGSPTGDKISFSSRRTGTTDLYVQAADGAGEPELILATPYHEFVTDWSPDGNYLICDRHLPTGVNIAYFHRREDGGEYEAVPFTETPFAEFGGDLSPDGRFLAYESEKSGKLEIHVQSFPEGGAAVQVSTRGGRQPRWRSDGKEIFYVEDDVNLMAVSVNTDSGFSVRSTPERLFTDEEAFQGMGHRYDVTPDGQHFLMRKILERPKASIHVAQDWFAEFRDRQ